VYTDGDTMELENQTVHSAGQRYDDGSTEGYQSALKWNSASKSGGTGEWKMGNGVCSKCVRYRY
jgi:hypothetical protein